VSRQRQLTIFHLESSKDFGGQERRTLHEMSALIEQGHRVFLVAPRDSKIVVHACK